MSRQLRGHKQSAVSDLFSGLTNGQIEGDYGHELSYWNQSSICQEAFAHMYEAQFDPKRYEVMKNYFPNALNIFEQMLGGIS